MSTNDRVFRIAPPKPNLKTKLNAFQRHHKLEVAIASAKYCAPKPSSWWTRFANGEVSRGEFVAAVNRREDERRQKMVSSAGIAVTRPIARLGGLE